jgi:hypothetical protein
VTSRSYEYKPMTNKNLLLGLSLSVLLIFGSAPSTQAAESAWQGLTSGLESGFSGTVHNCSPLTITNGSVGAYPSCTITCNSGFNLVSGACVAPSGAPIVSSGGGGGGGGGGSSFVSCSAVTYSDWGACSGGLQNRTVLSSSPVGCTLTTNQQIATQQSCTVVSGFSSGGSGIGIGLFKSKAPSGSAVLGAKTYPDFTALRDSKTGAIYVIYKDGKYKIKNLKELTLYKIKKTISVDTAFLKTFKDLAKYPTVPKKK